MTSLWRVLFVWRVWLFFNHYYYYEFCVFRVACTVIFTYYYYHEFCVFGWRARLRFFIIAYSYELCFSGGVHGYFLITTTIVSFVFRVACAVIFNYYYYYEFCFRVACAVISQILILPRVLFPGWRARLF